MNGGPRLVTKMKIFYYNNVLIENTVDGNKFLRHGKQHPTHLAFIDFGSHPFLLSHLVNLLVRIHSQWIHFFFLVPLTSFPPPTWFLLTCSSLLSSLSSAPALVLFKNRDPVFWYWHAPNSNVFNINTVNLLESQGNFVYWERLRGTRIHSFETRRCSRSK